MSSALKTLLKLNIPVQEAISVLIDYLRTRIYTKKEVPNIISEKGREGRDKSTPSISLHSSFLFRDYSNSVLEVILSSAQGKL